MSDTWQPTEHGVSARRLLRATDSGVLSTWSTELEGYPFGSVTPYVLSHEGRVAIYVSDIAQHTHNMRADRRVCITVLEAPGPAADRQASDRQASGRVTVVGDAEEVDAQGSDAVTLAERYFAFFPNAREYAATHGFHIFAIRPQRVRYIGGFGKIAWVEAADWRVPAPEWAQREAELVAHMNDDHPDALLQILRSSRPEIRSAELVALDVEGFHVRSEAGIAYVPFPRPCPLADDVRAAMIELVRDARGTAPAAGS